MDQRIFDEKFRGRVWSKIDKRGIDECWPWTGATQFGYGYIWIVQQKIHAKAHRVVYAYTHGDFDSSLCVCHHCDNPPCCNPSHLFLGTRAENNRDRDNKGRYPDRRGEKNGHTKLTRLQVDEIRHLVSCGQTQLSVANQYGIKQPQVSRIVLRKLWKEQP